MCARLLDDPEIALERKTAILQDVIRGFRGLVALSIFENGVEVATVYDEATLRDASLTQEEVARSRWEHPPLPTGS